MFHVVYLSFEETGRCYIGKHSTENPYDEYLGSYRDKKFNPGHKIILEYSNTEEGAVEAEIRWQKVFNVVEDPLFANQSYQSSNKFHFKPNKSGEVHQNSGKKIYHDPQTQEEKRFSSPPGGNWVLGRSPKFCAKLSVATSKRKHPPEVKAKIAQGRLGKKHTSEAKEKISAARKRVKL
jgi:hypothetical protein